MTSLPALESLQLHDVMPRCIELNAVEAVLRARILRIGAGDVQRGSIIAAAKVAIGWVARRWQIREWLAGWIEHVNSGLVARAGGGVDVARGVESHAIDAAAGAEIEEHAFAFQ